MDLSIALGAAAAFHGGQRFYLHRNQPLVVVMPKYLIEREVPGISKLGPAELHALSKRSVGVLRQLGPEIQWMESYVAGDNLYCVYMAPDPEMVREHARLGGFPCNKVSEIKTMIDPTTAEETYGPH